MRCATPRARRARLRGGAHARIAGALVAAAGALGVFEGVARRARAPRGRRQGGAADGGARGVRGEEEPDETCCACGNSRRRRRRRRGGFWKRADASNRAPSAAQLRCSGAGKPSGDAAGAPAVSALSLRASCVRFVKTILSFFALYVTGCSRRGARRRAFAARARRLRARGAHVGIGERRRARATRALAPLDRAHRAGARVPAELGASSVVLRDRNRALGDRVGSPCRGAPRCGRPAEAHVATRAVLQRRCARRRRAGWISGGRARAAERRADALSQRDALRATAAAAGRVPDKAPGGYGTSVVARAAQAWLADPSVGARGLRPRARGAN